MATIIDRLVVLFDLDPSGYNKGAKDIHEGQERTRKESERTRKQFEEDGRKTVEAFREIKNQVLELAAVFVGFEGLKSFIENIVRTNVEVGRLAEILGMSTEDLSAWEGAAKRFGDTNGEGINNMFRALQKLNEEYRLTGTFAGMETVAKVGGRAGMEAILNNMGNVQAQARALMTVMSSLNPAAQQTLGRAFGANEVVSAMLGRERDATKAIEDQKRLYVVQQRNKEMWEKIEKQLLDIKDRFKSIGETLLSAILPTIMRLTIEFENWLGKDEHVKKLHDAIEKFASFLENDVPWTEIGGWIEFIATKLGDAITAVGGLGNAMKILFALWATFKAVSLAAAFAELLIVLTNPALLAAAVALAAPFAIIAAGVAALAMVPRVDAAQGAQDLSKGDWLAAASHLNVSDFASAVRQRYQQHDTPGYRTTGNGDQIIHIDSLNVDVVLPHNADPEQAGRITGSAIKNTLQAQRGPQG